MCGCFCRTTSVRNPSSSGIKGRETKEKQTGETTCSSELPFHCGGHQFTSTAQQHVMLKLTGSRSPKSWLTVTAVSWLWLTLGQRTPSNRTVGPRAERCTKGKLCYSSLVTVVLATANSAIANCTERPGASLLLSTDLRQTQKHQN